MRIEYWVWYGEFDSIQAKPIAKFDDLDECKQWCEDELGGYVELERAFHARDDEYVGVGCIGTVEDHISNYRRGRDYRDNHDQI